MVEGCARPVDKIMRESFEELRMYNFCLGLLEKDM